MYFSCHDQQFLNWYFFGWSVFFTAVITPTIIKIWLDKIKK